MKLFILCLSLVGFVNAFGAENAKPVAKQKRTTASTELSHAYCGTLKDYGDSYQIMDGMFDVYLTQDDSAPADPKGIVKAIISDKLTNGCVCIVGVAESYDRGGQTAYSFKQITGLKTCKDLVK